MVVDRTRHLPKSVYYGKEYTMVVINTHTDGNVFLSIFDNNKKISDEELGEDDTETPIK